MGFNKKFFTTGGIVAASPSAAPFDPLQNFETVTYTGNGGTQKITGYIRKGAAFNGSDSKIITTYEQSTVAQSYSLWINPSAVNVRAYILNSYPSGTIGESAFYIELTASGQIEAGIRDGGVTKTVTSSSISANVWTHIVLTIDSSNLKLYINNGTPTTTSISISSLTGSRDPIAIGRDTRNDRLSFNGVIDQVRFFNTTLPATGAASVDALYGETYASSTKSTTDIFGDGSGVALYELDEDAGDTGVYGSGRIDTGQAADLDGTQALQTNLTSDTSAFTVAFWFKNTALPTNIYLFANNRSTSANETLSIYHNDSSNAIGVVTTSGNDTNINSVLGNKSIPLNRWTHVAVTVNGTSLKIYVDGVEDKSATLTHTPTTTSTYPFYIGSLGAWTGNTNFNLDGSVDEFRFYKSELSASEIENITKHDLASLTSTPYMYLKFDNNVTDQQSNVTVTGSTPTYLDGASYPVWDGTPTNVNFLGMAFQPDLVWIKNRDIVVDHALIDSVRGATEVIRSNQATAETTRSDSLTSFDSNGFTLGSDGVWWVNKSGDDYVAWCWKAGGAAVSGTGTGGASAVTYSANPSAGFSIVKYTKSGTTGTMTHGLDSAPEIIFEKRTDDAAYWNVRVNGITANNQTIYLNESTGVSTHPSLNLWTTPTTSVFGYDSANATAGDYIAYCFHSVDGYQKIGSYTGDRPTTVSVATGFQPRFVMIKCNASGESWTVVDSARGDKLLHPDTSGADQSYTGVSFTPTGFEVHDTGLANTNGATHIYLAIK